MRRVRLKKRNPLTALSYKAGQAVDVLRGPVSGRPARIIAIFEGLAVLVIEEAEIAVRNLREWDSTILEGSFNELETATKEQKTGILLILLTDFDNIRPAKRTEGR